MQSSQAVKKDESNEIVCTALILAREVLLLSL